MNIFCCADKLGMEYKKLQIPPNAPIEKKSECVNLKQSPPQIEPTSPPLSESQEIQQEEAAIQEEMDKLEIRKQQLEIRKGNLSKKKEAFIPFLEVFQQSGLKPEDVVQMFQSIKK